MKKQFISYISIVLFSACATKVPLNTNTKESDRSIKVPEIFVGGVISTKDKSVINR